MKTHLIGLISLGLLLSCMQEGIQRQEEEVEPKGEVHHSIQSGAYDAGAGSSGRGAAGFQEANLND